MSVLQAAWELIADVGPRDIIDIILVAVLMYYLLRLLRRTRAMSLVNGLIVVLLVFLLSSALLPTLYWLLKYLLAGGVLALVVIFQPELRMALARLGRGGLLGGTLGRIGVQRRQSVISDVVDTAYRISEDGYGALIVIERESGLMDIIRTGKILNAQVSVDLLRTLFYPSAALHDGAVVIREDQIVAAGCALPHSENPSLSASTGMRHRAALGLAERTDAVCVVVSEETRAVSLAVDGAISPRIERPQLTERLMELLEAQEQEPGFFFWRK